MNQKTLPAYLFVIAFFLVAGFASMAAIAKSDNAKNDNAQSDKTAKSENVKEEKVKNENTQKTAAAIKGETKNNSIKVELKNYEKSDATKGDNNAKVYKEKTDDVVKGLGNVADNAKAKGETELAEEIEAVADDQEEIADDTAQAMEQIENRSRIKTFFVGDDYKNLGQLRSNLSHIENQIRSLTKTMSQVQTQDDLDAIKEQLTTMTQERERIRELVSANDDSFSLLGWMFRLMNGYEKPEDDTDDSLTDDVVNAIADAQETVDANTTTDTEEETSTAIEDTTASDETTDSGEASDDTTTTDAELVQ